MMKKTGRWAVSGPETQLQNTTSANSVAVHIIYTEKPQDEEPESYHIRTLTSVLGSEDATREALICNYKNAASGFLAKLTPTQVAQISGSLITRAWNAVAASGLLVFAGANLTFPFYMA